MSYETTIASAAPILGPAYEPDPRHPSHSSLDLYSVRVYHDRPFLGTVAHAVGGVRSVIAGGQET